MSLERAHASRPQEFDNMRLKFEVILVPVNYLLSGVKLTVCLVVETHPWRRLTLLAHRNLVT